MEGSNRHSQCGRWTSRASVVYLTAMVEVHRMSCMGIDQARKEGGNSRGTRELHVG